MVREHIKTGQVRVRYAPSPTGMHHIGGARTALFNWLFARKHKGVFVLRIEDTDVERSKPEYERDILETLAWLGLAWDEGPPFAAETGEERAAQGSYGPYRQSERLHIYERYLDTLLHARMAYHCFCTKEELEQGRQASLAQGMPPRYSGRCRQLSGEEAAKRLHAGEPAIIRFKTPETSIKVHDLIRGDVSFDMALLGDFAIAKNMRSPLYNFSAVVDDYEMRISHVIRAEDHLANTPKQLLIQRALGFPHPHYAHVPLILNPDRSKMSKRYEATAVSEYRKAGYLPHALVNFLALLGWHPADDRELFTVEELASAFDLARVQKGGAAFNTEKLNWLNAQYLRALPLGTLVRELRVRGELPAETDEESATRLVALARERMKTLNDFRPLVDFAFELPEYRPELLIWKATGTKETRENIERSAALLSGLSDREFTLAGVETALRSLTELKGRGEVLWPLRVALSGREASPGPYEIMEALGKPETLRRLQRAAEKLATAA